MTVPYFMPCFQLRRNTHVVKIVYFFLFTYRAPVGVHKRELFGIQQIVQKRVTTYA